MFELNSMKSTSWMMQRVVQSLKRILESAAPGIGWWGQVEGWCEGSEIWRMFKMMVLRFFSAILGAPCVFFSACLRSINFGVFARQLEEVKWWKIDDVWIYLNHCTSLHYISKSSMSIKGFAYWVSTLGLRSPWNCPMQGCHSGDLQKHEYHELARGHDVTLGKFCKKDFSEVKIWAQPLRKIVCKKQKLGFKHLINWTVNSEAFFLDDSVRSWRGVTLVDDQHCLFGSPSGPKASGNAVGEACLQARIRCMWIASKALSKDVVRWLFIANDVNR